MAAWTQQGPYQLTPVPRLCPQCQAPLVMAGALRPQEASGLLGRLGVACHCVRCNTKYRAQGRVSVPAPLWWVAPPIARRLWWAAAEVTLVTTMTSDTNFCES